MRHAAIRFAAVFLLASPLGLATPCRSADLDITAPNVSGTPGSLVDIPITVSPSPAGLGILSLDFRLAFDPAVVFGSSSLSDGFLQSWGTPFVSGTGTYLAAAAAGTTPISSSSTLLNTVRVRLRPNAVIGTNMPLAFNYFHVNEGSPTISVTPGVLHVIAPPAGVPMSAPAALTLALASPNPARGEALFAYGVPDAAGARLAIYSVDGRLAREFALAASGLHDGTLRWDLRSSAGSRVRPGVYLARLERAGESVTRRLIVLE